MNRTAPEGHVFVSIRRMRHNQHHFIGRDGGLYPIPERAAAILLDAARLLRKVLEHLGGGYVVVFWTSIDDHTGFDDGGAA